jgi:hypothetical protein
VTSITTLGSTSCTSPIRVPTTRSIRLACTPAVSSPPRCIGSSGWRYTGPAATCSDSMGLPASKPYPKKSLSSPIEKPLKLSAKRSRHKAARLLVSNRMSPILKARRRFSRLSRIALTRSICLSIMLVSRAISLWSSCRYNLSGARIILEMVS